MLLPDGRRLDIRVSGHDGHPIVVFHHGTPGARIPSRALERAVHRHGLRLLTISRPGYGGSSRLRGRRIVDVVADISVALDALGAARCLVAGWSGGGPHALACAARLEGTAAALIIAGVAPYPADGIDWMAGMGAENVAEFGAALAGEDRLRSYLDALGPDLEPATVADFVSSLGTLLPDVDRAVLTDEYGEDMIAGFHEALRTGIDGWLDDDIAHTTAWGFGVEEISIPVMLWQGSADRMVPFAHGQWLAARLSGVTAHLQPGEGHLSIGLGALDQMLDELNAAGGLS